MMLWKIVDSDVKQRVSVVHSFKRLNWSLNKLCSYESKFGKTIRFNMLGIVNPPLPEPEPELIQLIFFYYNKKAASFSRFP